jgi:uncharacterized protein DUF3323
MAEIPDWLTDPALEPVWQRVADALEQRGLTPAGRVVVTGLDRASRHATAGILGRRVLTDRVRIDLVELDRFLRERSGIGGLREVVEAVRGEALTDRAALRSDRCASREAPFAAARAWLAAHPEPPLPWADEWLAGLRRTGYLSRRHDPVGMVERALEVLADRTGTTGEAEVVSRVDLAARICGDAHALDDDRPLAYLVLRGLATASGEDPPGSAAERRALWERVAVQTDAVSSTCLTFGVRDGLAHLTPGPGSIRRTVPGDGRGVHGGRTQPGNAGRAARIARRGSRTSVSRRLRLAGDCYREQVGARAQRASMADD